MRIDSSHAVRYHFNVDEISLRGGMIFLRVKSFYPDRLIKFVIENLVSNSKLK